MVEPALSDDDPLGGLWYTVPEFEADALTKTSRIRQRSLESRTIVIPNIPSYESAFRIATVVPEFERKRTYEFLSGSREHWPRDPSFYVEGGRGYWLLEASKLRSLSSLSELFWLPHVGVYGRPTAIINGSKTFSDLLGDEGHLLALMHEVPYLDVSRDEPVRSVPLRGFSE